MEYRLQDTGVGGPPMKVIALGFNRIRAFDVNALTEASKIRLTFFGTLALSYLVFLAVMISNS